MQAQERFFFASIAVDTRLLLLQMLLLLEMVAVMRKDTIGPGKKS